MTSTAETGEISDQLTNLAAPLSAATITVRVIKSFEYRTEKSLVLHALDLEHMTVGDLKERVRNAVKTEAGWKPYRTVQLDTLKLYTKAHGAKTTNLIINLDHDDWILDDDSAILASIGFGEGQFMNAFRSIDSL
ncbi:cytoplasm protein, putative [Rhizoctonia solani AG-3 Rhs1AP]|uniref:Cytoplasm protein, putative n=2 Tax=Rhizoctonia solani AG-3 TaxID=1086053 RepID=X8JEK2_9AGAM|nr:cytoplasm protein, putative [Rhizoctonia solani AG-3 Rhs1AP]KEP52997.1 putative cytoplasm protein [Rhizoctonia solani 123E]